jgi:cyclic pyranopterin phosphate synthase
VLRGSEFALKAGLAPVKINCVIGNSRNEKDAQEVTRFCERNGLEVRYIKEMDLGKGIFSVVDGGTGGNCAICNRIRLTSNGKLKPCLFSNGEYDIRELGCENAINMAVGTKPGSGKKNQNNNFYNIGG